jgi:hypothetical protein
MAQVHAMSHVRIPAVAVEHTLTFLRRAGAERNAEGVVLWLGKRTESGVEVLEALIPEQQAARDMFRIPPAAMAALLRHLGDTRTFIAAQVHSHPRRAFHSHADDTWAIIRHVGALSIVVPDFARNASIQNFIAETAAYCLSRDNAWELVPPEDVQRQLTIV